MRRRAETETVLGTTDVDNLPQRQVIEHIRRARAHLMPNQMDKFREYTEMIWSLWATELPAFVKQLHYQRGLSAFTWWSANDIGMHAGQILICAHVRHALL